MPQHREFSQNELRILDILRAENAMKTGAGFEGRITALGNEFATVRNPTGLRTGESAIPGAIRDRNIGDPAAPLSFGQIASGVGQGRGPTLNQLDFMPGRAPDPTAAPLARGGPGVTGDGVGAGALGAVPGGSTLDKLRAASAEIEERRPPFLRGTVDDRRFKQKQAKDLARTQKQMAEEQRRANEAATQAREDAVRQQEQANRLEQIKQSQANQVTPEERDAASKAEADEAAKDRALKRELADKAAEGRASPQERAAVRESEILVDDLDVLRDQIIDTQRALIGVTDPAALRAGRQRIQGLEDQAMAKKKEIRQTLRGVQAQDQEQGADGGTALDANADGEVSDDERLFNQISEQMKSAELTPAQMERGKQALDRLRKKIGLK